MEVMIKKSNILLIHILYVYMHNIVRGVYIKVPKICFPCGEPCTNYVATFTMSNLFVLSCIHVK